MQLVAVLRCYEFHRESSHFSSPDHLVLLSHPDKKNPGEHDIGVVSNLFELAVLAQFLVRYVVLEPHLSSSRFPSESSELHIFDVRVAGCAMLPYNARYIVFLIFLVMDELKSAHLFRLADFIFVSFLAMSFLYERCRSIVVQYPE